MTPLVLAALAAITYGSRLAAMVALPRPTGRVEATLARVPAAIFASLATLSLISPDRTMVEAPILMAALGAIVAAPRRSFALCLVGGLAGYLVGELLLPPAPALGWAGI